MSNRTTQKNIPLPVLGSTGWGSNLNSYLRANSYRQSAIEEELQDLYEQQNNATQTILSSGVMSLNVGTRMPGLYKNTGAAWTYVEDGDEIEITGTYGYFGYGAVLSNVNIVKQLETTDPTGIDHHVLTIDFSYDTTKYTGLDLQTSTSNYDARCVYAYYNNNSWSVRFAATDTPSTETSISIHPQYICLGVVFQWETKLYWHYKTMKSSLSLSVKKWMLDEPHASLDTYMNLIDNAGTKTLVPFVVSEGQPTKLHIQALGINPFSVNESITSELDADLFTMNFATKNDADNTIVSNFVILHAYNDGSNTVYKLYTPPTTGGVEITEYKANTKYRLCATSLCIDTSSTGSSAYKWVLLLQEAINDSTLNTSLFNDNDFNRLYYYADPVELYRLENSSLHANPGNGISTINANGINPHISTLIKNDDAVFFGESVNDYFHFKTETKVGDPIDTTRSGIIELWVPNSTQTSPATSVMLTNNMQAINTEIQIQNTLRGTGSDTDVNNKIWMRAGRAAKNYNNLSLHSHQGSEGGIMHFSGTGAIKLQAYTGKTSSFDIDTVTDAQASIDIYSKVGGDVSQAKIDLKSKYINLYGDTAVVPVTKNFQFNDGTAAYCVVQNPDGDRPKLLIGKTTDKQIALLADGDKATIKLGNVSGGGCTTLSSDGLYFPSSANIDGIKIDSLLGAGTNASSTFVIDCAGLSFNSDIIYDTLSSLPSVKSWLEDKIINPWGANKLQESYSDIIGKNIQNISIRLKRNGGTSFYNVDSDWRYWTNNLWRTLSGSSELRLTFREDQTILECTAGHYIEVEKIEVTFNFTPFQQPILSVNSFNNGIMHIKSIGDSQGAVLVVDSVDNAGHIYCGTNNRAIRINTNNSAVTIEESTDNIAIGKNTGNITIGENTGDIAIGKSTGSIAIKESTGSITLENAIITSLKTKIGKRVAIPTNMNIPDSVLEFYESFMSMIPIEVTPSISLRNRYHKLGYPTAISTDYNSSNYFSDISYMDRPGPTIYCGHISGNTALSHSFVGDNPRNHEWIKINIKSGSASATDGWASWNLWALTGVQNRYKWLNVDKFYFQLGKEGSSSCEYFEIDYRYGVLPTNSSYKDPLIGYMRNNWYTQSPDGSLDLTARIFIQDSMSTGLHPALADSNNLDAGLTNDIKALQYAIDADFGSSPILWHLITEDEKGAAKRYKVYLDWSTDTNYRPTKDSTGKVHAPYAYDIHWRQ